MPVRRGHRISLPCVHSLIFPLYFFTGFPVSDNECEVWLLFYDSKEAWISSEVMFGPLEKDSQGNHNLTLCVFSGSKVDSTIMLYNIALSSI